MFKLYAFDGQEYVFLAPMFTESEFVAETLAFRKSQERRQSMAIRGPDGFMKVFVYR